VNARGQRCCGFIMLFSITPPPLLDFARVDEQNREAQQYKKCREIHKIFHLSC
jgi:hypothetical protein